MCLELMVEEFQDLGCCSMFHMGDMDSDCTWLPGSPAADRGGWGWGALMYGVQGTCASHLTVVVVHYGCAAIAYLKPKSENAIEKDLLLSVTYTIITPLLNPVVYSLRNKEVKDALCRAVGRISS